MRATNISGRNIKGVLNFNHDLDSLNLFTGKNHLGKTARLDALKLALLQFHPDFSNSENSHAAHFQLSSGASMECGVVVEDETGKHSGRVNLSQKKINGPIEHDNHPLPEHIFNGKIGGVCLDPLSYFALGPTDRMRYVFERATMPEGFTAEKIKERLEKIEIDGHDGELAKKHIFGGVVYFQIGQTTGMDDLSGWIYEGTENLTDPTEFIERVISNMSDCAKSVKEETEVEEKYIKKLAAEMIGDISGSNAERLQKELLQVNAGRDTAISNKARLEASGTVQEYIEAQNTIAELENRLGQYPPVNIAAIKAELRELESSIDENRYAELCKKNSELTDLTIAGGKLKHECEFIRQDISTLNTQLKELDEADSCEFCGASEAGWKLKNSTAIRNKIIKLSADLKPLSIERCEKQTEYKALKKEADLAQVENEKTEQKRIRVRKVSEKILEIERNELKRDRIWKEIEDEKKTTLPDVEKIQSIDENIQKHSSRQTEINESLRLIEVAKNNQANATKANDKLNVIVYRHTLVEMIRKELKVIQSEMVKAVFDSVLKPANDIAKDFFKGRIEYRAGEIGYVHPSGKFIIAKLWSGTEKAVGFAAIGIGLASTSKFRLLVIDELLRLHPDSLNDILEKIEQALESGLIDQFIGIAPTLDNINVSNKFKIIEVTE